MNWLARLSATQAVRWALVWPACVVALALGAVLVVATAQWRGNWGFAFSIEPRGPTPVWLGVTVFVVVVLVVPPAIFLALWRLARH